MVASKDGPPDGGWGWMCVFGKLYCFFCTFGTASAFGIMYIDLIDYFNSTREATAWIGSLNAGLSSLAGPLSSVLTSRFGIQKATAVGAFIAFTGCLISWFANGIPYLYVSYGIIMGTGLGIILVPSVVIIPLYFKTRLGLANAVGSVGTGLGTFVFPYIYTHLLEEYAWRGTLLLLSGIVLNLIVCAVIFIPPSHLKGTKGETSSKSITLQTFKDFFRFLCKPYNAIYIIGTSLAIFGYIVPYTHLPDMAVQMGIDKVRAAYLISIMGASNMTGRILFGWIIDFQCVNVIFLQVLSLITCGVVTAVCPHLTEFYALAVYSVIYGIFTGVFLSLIPLSLMVLVGLQRTGDAFGIYLFLAGIMYTLSSPVAGWLFDTNKTYKISFYVASCPFILAGIMVVLAMVLHKRQTSKEKRDAPDSQQNSSHEHTLEQTHM